MAKEAARERAMHRYYQPWLETFGGICTDQEPLALPPPPSQQAVAHNPRSSRDKALTAFAQLGCLRLNAKRSIITLLSTTKQYIIAEATKTLSLLSDTQHDQGDDIWFGNASVERGVGVSHDAMNPETYAAYDPDGKAYTTPALVISDISAHDTYKTRSFAGHGVSFYSGVPITNHQGHVIGVYSVTDDKPRGRLSATELCFLADMSVIVMQHLETVKNDRIRTRGELLIRGIGGFIEGEESRLPEKEGSNRKSDQDRKTSPPNTTIDRFLGMVITDANKSSENPDREKLLPLGRPDSASRAKPPEANHERSLDHETNPTPTVQKAPTAIEKAIRQSQDVFDRAADILRHCLGSDGVMFLDASSANLGSGTKMDSSGSVGRLHHSKSKAMKRSEKKHEMQQTRGLENTAPTNEPSASSDSSTGTGQSQSDSSLSQKRRRQACRILGRSVLDPKSTISFPDEQALRRFVRRYPKGKCFMFDQFGKPAYSDEGSETASASDVISDTTLNPDKRVPTTSALLKALPGARTVVFLPLWDFAKERWHCGLVVWSNDPGSLTNVEDNMIYLKAFNNAVMNEVHRLDLILSDTAKSTFLANISHELRTPLHGILGSIEFLHDTAMDDFQSSMVISVETCGKTLLDTVNHVLDYTKIQNLSRSDRGAKGGIQNADHLNKPETSLIEDFDVAIVVEEVVEAVYAGQVFRTANADVLQGKTVVQTSASRAMQQRQERRAKFSKGSVPQKDPMCLTLNIDDHKDWRVRSQPGAVRRIVMNILGNALKYTTRGSINVTLEVDSSRSQSSSNLHLMLQIADTGQGMRTDFLKNHAFTAFSQEDSLATGTGLGLSIVRQIVDSLGGKVDMSSEKNVGTEVRIWLSLPKSQRELNTDSEYNAIPAIRELTRGREMCMLLPYGEKSSEVELRTLIPMPTIESSMRNLLAQWFRMKVTSTESLDGKTMDNLSPDFFIYPEPPPIDYLMDFHGTPNTAKEVPVIIVTPNSFESASLRSNGIHELNDIGKIIEVIPQPCGPQKLAKVLHRCIQRLEMWENTQPKKRSTQIVPWPIKKDESRAKEDSPKQGDNSDQIDVRGQDEDKMPQNQSASDPRDLLTLPEPLRSTRTPSSKDKLRLQKPSLMMNGTSTEDSEITGQTSSPDGENIMQPLQTNKPRVLVVDDNHINLHLLVTFVRKSGHPYESASDGLEALEAYKKSVQKDTTGRYAFKYILMDISMPVMNGIAATKEIRKFEKETGVQKPATIIALTGMGTDVAEGEARDAGFDQFLSKPVKFRTLVKLLV